MSLQKISIDIRTQERLVFPNKKANRMTINKIELTPKILWCIGAQISSKKPVLKAMPRALNL
jgi:hypothetical protein